MCTKRQKKTLHEHDIYIYIYSQQFAYRMLSLLITHVVPVPLVCIRYCDECNVITVALSPHGIEQYMPLCYSVCMWISHIHIVIVCVITCSIAWCGAICFLLMVILLFWFWYSASYMFLLLTNGEWCAVLFKQRVRESRAVDKDIRLGLSLCSWR